MYLSYLLIFGSQGIIFLVLHFHQLCHLFKLRLKVDEVLLRYYITVVSQYIINLFCSSFFLFSGGFQFLPNHYRVLRFVFTAGLLLLEQQLFLLCFQVIYIRDEKLSCISLNQKINMNDFLENIVMIGHKNKELPHL